MMDSACFCHIQHLHAHQGLSASQMAKALTLALQPVSYGLAQAHFRPRQPRPCPSTRDPFTPEMVRLLER